MKQPPLMRRWMHHTSLVLQFIGLIIAFISGIYFAILYICAMILSVCYSKPSIRWKGRPFLSLIVIGLGNGIISYNLGFISYGSIISTTFSLHLMRQAYFKQFKRDYFGGISAGKTFSALSHLAKTLRIIHKVVNFRK